MKSPHPLALYIAAVLSATLLPAHAAAVSYFLVVEYSEKPCQGDHFDRLGLTVEKAKDGRIHILDRSKPKSTP